MEKRSGAWGQVNVNEKRVEFVIRAGRGREKMTALCREFSISRQTGYKWLRRYRGCREIGELGEQSRRPRRSPRKTAPELEQRVVEMRRKWPDWGAPMLAWTLEQEGVKMPWITVHRILKRHGLVSEEVVRPATQRFERAQPNELVTSIRQAVDLIHNLDLPKGEAKSGPAAANGEVSQDTNSDLVPQLRANS